MRDDQFIRGQVPMTKSEVRAVSLSKLELKAEGVLYDIGAGTGSVSVEAARLLVRGQVYAIERNEAACRLINQNKARFQTGNLTVVHGTAPGCLEELPAPDYVFVGGTGGSLPVLMDMIVQRNPRVRVVINVIALESLAQVVEWMQTRQRPAEIVSVQIARSREAGGYHLMEGGNPVYVIAMGGPDE